MSLCEWMAQTHGFIYYIYWSMRDTCDVFSIYRLNKWGHKYMNNISRTALSHFMTIWPINLRKTTTTQTKLFTATRQNKSYV